MAEQASELLKNKYNLGFPGLTETVKETELECRLIKKIKYFILEQDQALKKQPVAVFSEGARWRSGNKKGIF
ncbi:DUF1016 family protein [Sinomicrobium sp. 2019215]|nr:DUF1016 family protein [Sinomicrobium weinanense]